MNSAMQASIVAGDAQDLFQCGYPAVDPALAILPAWLSYGPESGILTLALAIIMFSRHYHGLLRIRQGTEPRFFQRRNPK